MEKYRAVQSRVIPVIAIRPNAKIMIPENLLIQSKTLGVSFAFSKLTVLLRTSHHTAEPANPVTTREAAEPESTNVLPSPRLAKTPTKERIVIGFVRVKKKVDT